MIFLHFPKILTLIYFLRVIHPVSCLTFSYPSFQTSNNNLHFSQNSLVAFSAIQVTPDNSRASIMTNQSGRATYMEPFQLWKTSEGGGRIVGSFNSTFVINITPMSDPGGEGMAFILTDDNTLPEDSNGQWLGIVNQESNGTSKIVAIEFDTFKSYSEDLDDNHVGLDLGSIFSIKQVSLTDYGVKLASASDVEVDVVYDGKSRNLTVFVKNATDESRNAIFSETIDLSKYLSENVYVGFSGSTSDKIELNCVKSWDFYSSDIDDDNDLIWVWITVPVLAAIVLFSFGFLLYKKLYKSNQTDPEGNIEDQINNATAPRRFRLKELRKATGNFNSKNKLGKGGFGTVYKGLLGNKEIAVKRVSKKSSQGKQEFISEVTTIGNLNHRNLVKLIGWCYESRDLVLVYEYMPNGSLEKYIFSDDNNREDLTLDWETRVSIIYGVAQSLEYLHYGCEKRILHRDIKASNIMLDSEFNPRLGDFGLARTIQEKEKTHHSTIEIAGTPGYMAPETFLISRATVETDVYSFGVLILEVVCGRKLGHLNELQNYNSSIVNWIWDLYKKGRIVDGADSKLEERFEPEQMEAILILGLACCHPNPNLRPCMKTVLQVLTGETDPPQVPLERPSFVWPAAMPPSFCKSEYSMTGSQIAQFTEITGR